MFKLFRNKRPAFEILLIAQLNDRSQPMDRGEIYEDPLDEMLQKEGVGEVSGGGTQLGENNEIKFCDIEVMVKDASIAQRVVEVLEKLGAPKGSKLTLSEGEDIPFGKNEGLALYLNGKDLPDDVYEKCDSNHVYSEMNRLLGEAGKVHSHWQGPTETALYLYGASFDEMKKRISGFLSEYPLCQKCRILKIA